MEPKQRSFFHMLFILFVFNVAVSFIGQNANAQDDHGDVGYMDPPRPRQLQSSQGLKVGDTVIVKETRRLDTIASIESGNNGIVFFVSASKHGLKREQLAARLSFDESDKSSLVGRGFIENQPKTSNPLVTYIGAEFEDDYLTNKPIHGRFVEVYHLSDIGLEVSRLRLGLSLIGPKSLVRDEWGAIRRVTHVYDNGIVLTENSDVELSRYGDRASNRERGLVHERRHLSSGMLSTLKASCEQSLKSLGRALFPE